VTRRGITLFVAMGAIWGLPYLLIKVAVRDLEPATLVFCRTGIGAVILVPVALARGELAPLVRRWKPLVAYTVVEIGVPWVLLSTAEQRLPSSLSGLLVAAVPLVGAVLSVGLRDRVRLGPRERRQVGPGDDLAAAAVRLHGERAAIGPPPHRVVADAEQAGCLGDPELRHGAGV